MSENYGKFSGNPKTEWLTHLGSADRDMKLLEDFWYTDPDGEKWRAPTGSIINGASIPRPLWSTVGSPYTDDYRNASVVHDVACDDPQITPAKRKKADKMFYYACLAGGCSTSQARLLYLGVRIGAWTTKAALPPLERTASLFRAPTEKTSTEIQLQDLFHSVAKQIEKQGDCTFEHLEKICNTALKK